MKKPLFYLFLTLPLALWGQTPTLVVPVGHSWGIKALAFSPPCSEDAGCLFGDGKYALAGGGDGIATLWEVQSGRQIQSFEGHANAISSVAFSPDGKYILTGSWDKTARLWDIQSGKTIRTFERDDGPATPSSFSVDYSQQITAVAFSPNGKYLLTGVADGTTILWNVPSGAQIRTFKSQTVTFSSNEQQVFTFGTKGADILDIQSGDILRSFEGVNSKIIPVFSPNGEKVLVGGEKGATLWDISSGRPIPYLEGIHSYITALAFSPDGKHFLTASKDGGAIFWDAGSGEKVHVFNDHSFEVTAVAFSPDGQFVLTGSDDNTAILWDARSGRKIRTLQGHADAVFHMGFSPDRKYILAYSSNVKGDFKLGGSSASIWDTRSGKCISTLLLDEVHKYEYPPIQAAFSADREKVLIGSLNTAALWDISSGKKIHSFGGVQSAAIPVALSGDGKHLLTGGKQALILWDAQSGEKIRDFKGVPSEVSALAFSADGRYALSGGTEAILLWDISSGLALQHFEGAPSKVTSVALSSDGHYALTGHKVSPVKKGNSSSSKQPLGKAAILWDVQSGKEVRYFNTDATRFTQVDFSPDGKYILTGWADDTNKESPEFTATVWDTQSGKQIRSSDDFTSQAFRGCLSPDGQFLLTGTWTSTVKLWDFQKGTEIASLNNLDSTDWAITTPSGLFDASPGAMRLMYYVESYKGEREIIELEQLKERYYEPGLLQKIVGYSDEPTRSVEGFDTLALYPALTLQLDTQTHQLAIELTPRNGGLGKVSVFVNGKEIIEDLNPPQGAERKRKSSLSVNLTPFSRYFLQDSLNTLSVRVYNEAGWLKSPAYTLAYRPRFPRAKGEPGDSGPAFSFQASDPALYAICIGTANYAGTQLDLKFPGKDALAMAQAIEQAGRQLFEDRVHVRLFTTDTADVRMHPTKTNIKAAFEGFKDQARAEDILLVYLSGHGVNYGDADRAQFYYLTQEIASENLSDEGIRDTRTLSTAELTQWINDIPAQKQVMILDACNSGKVVEVLDTGTKNLNSSQIRALDRMKDRTGMFVLAGSAADKVSYEASQYGQGLLTYSILEAMSGQRLREGKYVDIAQLFEYARDRVPEIAKSIGGLQTPTMLMPRSGSIDIGIVNEQVQISLSQVKPVFVRNVFLDEDRFDDVLKIGSRLEGKLREITAKGSRASLIYVDVPEYQQAYSIKGLYQVEGETVQLKARLFREGQALGDIQVQGTSSQLDALVEKILKQAFSLISKSEPE